MTFASFQAGKLYVRDSHPCIVEVGSKKTHFMSPLSIELGASYSEWNVFSEVTQILRDFGVTISYSCHVSCGVRLPFILIRNENYSEWNSCKRKRLYEYFENIKNARDTYKWVSRCCKLSLKKRIQNQLRNMPR